MLRVAEAGSIRVGKGHMREAEVTDLKIPPS